MIDHDLIDDLISGSKPHPGPVADICDIGYLSILLPHILEFRMDAER